MIKQGHSKSTYPEYFIDNNIENYNMSDIVNSFNKFLVNICSELAAEIPDHRVDLSIKQNPLTLFLSATSEQEMINVVLKCKSKSSTDCHDIDMTLVKKLILNITKPLTYICNLSFQSRNELPQWRFSMQLNKLLMH